MNRRLGLSLAVAAVGLLAVGVGLVFALGGEEREPGQTFHLTGSTTFRWMATDIKGNTSTGQQTFTIGAD